MKVGSALASGFAQQAGGVLYVCVQPLAIAGVLLLIVRQKAAHLLMGCSYSRVGCAMRWPL
jgi:hypothetical protein